MEQLDDPQTFQPRKEHDGILRSTCVHYLWGSARVQQSAISVHLETNSERRLIWQFCCSGAGFPAVRVRQWSWKWDPVWRCVVAVARQSLRRRRAAYHRQSCCDYSHTHTRTPSTSQCTCTITVNMQEEIVQGCVMSSASTADRRWNFRKKWRDFWCKYTTNNFTDADDAFLCAAKKQKYKKMLARVCEVCTECATETGLYQTRMWANAQPDGRPAEHRWRPLFSAAKFGWRPVLDAVQ